MGAGVKEHRGTLRLAVPCGKVKRRHAGCVRGIRVGTGLEQLEGKGVVAVEAGVVEGREPGVLFANINSHFLAEHAFVG